jgi:hypothetical protein
MNLLDAPYPCEEFELLVSCASDDELGFDEQMQLALHLEVCESCRQRRESFARLNELMSKLGHGMCCRNLKTSGVLIANVTPAIAESLAKSPNQVVKHSITTRSELGDFPKNSRPQGPLHATEIVMRIVSVAVAATVIIGLFAFYGTGNAEATATQVHAADIAVPLVSYSQMNFQRMRDQRALAETLDLELRALKLEIASIKDQEKSKSLTAAIDALLEKIKSIETNNSKIL